MPGMPRSLTCPLLGLLVLSACGQGQPAPSESVSPSAVDRATPTPPPIGSENGPILAPPLLPEAEKGEKGARNILLAWASALENRRFDEAYAQFGPGGPPDGMSASTYAEQFGRCRKITVAMPTGTMEGAAGSLFYSAPTTLTCELATGSSEQWKGEVILRRVNDVPGATADQLRWHIDQTDLKPAS